MLSSLFHPRQYDPKNPRRAKVIASEKWDEHRHAIENFHHQGKSKQSILRTLQTRRFKPSMSQLIRQMKLWGLRDDCRISSAGPSVSTMRDTGHEAPPHETTLEGEGRSDGRSNSKTQSQEISDVDDYDADVSTRSLRFSDISSVSSCGSRGPVISQGESSFSVSRSQSGSSAVYMTSAYDTAIESCNDSEPEHLSQSRLDYKSQYSNFSMLVTDLRALRRRKEEVIAKWAEPILDAWDNEGIEKLIHALLKYHPDGYGGADCDPVDVKERVDKHPEPHHSGPTHSHVTDADVAVQIAKLSTVCGFSARTELAVHILRSGLSSSTRRLTKDEIDSIADGSRASSLQSVKSCADWVRDLKLSRASRSGGRPTKSHDTGHRSDGSDKSTGTHSSWDFERVTGMPARKGQRKRRILRSEDNQPGSGSSLEMFSMDE